MTIKFLNTALLLVCPLTLYGNNSSSNISNRLKIVHKNWFDIAVNLQERKKKTISDYENDCINDTLKTIAPLINKSKDALDSKDLDKQSQVLQSLIKKLPDIKSYTDEYNRALVVTKQLIRHQNSADAFRKNLEIVAESSRKMRLLELEKNKLANKYQTGADKLEALNSTSEKILK